MADRLERLPDFPELVFDETPHIYRLNGDQIPSVSSVMEPLKNEVYAGIPEKTLRRAAEKGSAVHNSIENWLKYEFEDVPPEHRPYFDAFMAWWSMRKPEVVGSEVRLYHRLMRYAGTADLVCYIDGELNLIDYKTTYTVSEMSCGVQLEAYAQALASHGIQIERKRILHLKRDGKHREVNFQKNDAARWRVFGACKTVYDYVHAA